ncbi:cytidine deaminase-like protein [Pyronema domesticum]|uniref:Cytidine deaminase n=1 Tax=Pyronema omphalodes (strain CBS 100304) TaxID=1076935 RepID=U4KUL8_PYROM|nr:cytidine deaminase-like protein [Pyronema domesticum]KAI5782111.1 cytidine deaminase-like protein [Pyronema domesticum]KAI5785295.1 cytidine deaminase-like protein [Pyronema domesticum]CCX04431.1 Similar to Cytidine deaminase; acc. no. P32320 [Pyronema omphalodes CBS 100304]
MSSTNNLHGLTMEQFKELRSKTIAAKDVAYCPYSKFRVGSAVLCHDGTFVIGGNVENASYPVGICAERCTLVKAVTEGKKGFKALGVATDVKNPPASPCGMCRQFIREFCELTLPIFMFDSDGEHVVMTLGQLLPMSFGPDSLPSAEEMEKIRA